MFHVHLLSDTVQLAADDQLLILNSAADPFVPVAAHQLPMGTIILAEDNIAALQSAQAGIAHAGGTASQRLQHVAFHRYAAHYPPGTMNVAVINLLYQPSKAFITYGLEVAQYALKPGGHLYVSGAKNRGILSVARRMHEQFGNVETLDI